MTPFLALGALGCVDTAAPPNEDAELSGAAGDGAAEPGTGAGTSEAVASAMPAPAGAVFRCEDPAAPKLEVNADSPSIVDFETGALGAPSATGEASGNFMFTGSGNGGTYTYQEPGEQLVRTVSVVEDRNGGKALSVRLANASDYGGGMGVYFYPCADASVYDGLTLWARGSLPERMLDNRAIPAGTVTMTLDIGNVATSSRDSIGCAVDVPADATLCTRPSASFVVSETWSQFTFRWSDFAPGNRNGSPYVPNGDNLLGVNLTMDNAFGMPHDLELVIDDVAFVPR